MGGEHPHNLKNEIPDALNDTGIAYFDGNRWYHIWYSANEGFAARADFSFRIPPSLWEFQCNKILKDTSNELIIKSAHIVRFDNYKMNIDKYAIFKAGEPYFILIIRFKNTKMI